MAGYDIVSEFGGSGDSIAVDPYWVIAIIRFQNPLTYSRDLQKSFSDDVTHGITMRSSVLLITDDCVNMTVSSTKSSHVSTLNATILPNQKVNYMSEIMPGDWVFAWMVYGQDKFRSLTERIRENKQVNKATDGLKFVGRVENFRKDMRQDPNVGTRITRYSLVAAAFQEFDAMFYFNPYLAHNNLLLGEAWSAMGVSLMDVVENNAIGISASKALNAFLNVFLGSGVPAGKASLDGDGVKSTAGLEGPYAYIVPDTVNKLLGRNTSSKPHSSYADILDFINGIQSYSNTVGMTGGSLGRIFSPDLSDSTTTRLTDSLKRPETDSGDSKVKKVNRWSTTHTLLGTFTPTPPPSNTTSTWSILNEYVNHAVNEIYTTLRVNSYNEVVPTLIARQKPFSSNRAPANINVTKFLDLPRWKVDPILVFSANVGRADSQRFNFVQIFGDAGYSGDQDYTGQSIRTPFVMDRTDVARNGLRSFILSIPCHPVDIRTGQANVWNEIVADILMGQHLTMNGQLEMLGVSLPICVGDNLEIDEIVFHIEAISHTCGIAPNGTKSFRTSVALTYGISSDGKATGVDMYPSVARDNIDVLNPAVSSDYPDSDRIERTRPTTPSANISKPKSVQEAKEKKATQGTQNTQDPNKTTGIIK